MREGSKGENVSRSSGTVVLMFILWFLVSQGLALCIVCVFKLDPGSLCFIERVLTPNPVTLSPLFFFRLFCSFVYSSCVPLTPVCAVCHVLNGKEDTFTPFVCPPLVSFFLLKRDFYFYFLSLLRTFLVIKQNLERQAGVKDGLK